MHAAMDPMLDFARKLVDEVPDPELPMVSIGELGMVRSVEWTENGALGVAITPTYSGCPATEMIRQQVVDTLAEAGFTDAVVTWDRSQAWTTDWIRAEGREKLRAAGIAPPPPGLAVVSSDAASSGRPEASKSCAELFSTPNVECPRCGSSETERLAEHGSTPCKALYRCISCREPFDHFKCH